MAKDVWTKVYKVLRNIDRKWYDGSYARKELLKIMSKTHVYNGDLYFCTYCVINGLVIQYKDYKWKPIRLYDIPDVVKFILQREDREYENILFIPASFFIV